MENESHLIRDASTGDWVVVAPKRAHQPSSIIKKFVDHFSPKELKHEHVIATYGSGSGKITAIENKFPVFQAGKGVKGYQEILVEGAKIGAFANYSVKQIENVLHAYVERSKAIRKMKNLKSLVVFKNEGPAAGASQPHAHSQIFGLSFVPARWEEINQHRITTEKRRRQTSHALAIAEASSPRTVYADRFVTAFAHPAARFAYEVRILTRRKIDNITQAKPSEIVSLAKALHALLPFVRSRKLAYNFFFHDVFADTHEHFEMRFVPRMGIWGGFELDAGIAVNPVPAEAAAAEYLAAKKR